MGRRTFPDFCIVSPIKSASSDLAVNLMLHPNILMPLAKEFANANPESWRIYYSLERDRERHAKRLGVVLSPFFEPCLHSMELTYRLSKMRPDMKIVIVLRDPVTRAYAHWKWDVLLAGRKRADQLPFLRSFDLYIDKALNAYPEYMMYSSCGSSVLHASLYWKPVSYWIECFGSNNVEIMDIEDYFCNKFDFLNTICHHVGLPPMRSHPFNTRINENPLCLPAADKDSIFKLRSFFAPHNDRLWQLIDKRFSWE
jgi:hypothetical protein